MGFGASSRPFRLPILLASFALIGAYFMLQAQAEVLQSTAAPVCVSGSPAVIQRGPGEAEPADVVEIVTGWYRFDVGTDLAVADPTECAVNVPVTGATTAPYDVKGAVQWWIFTDLLFFAPAYGTVLVLILLWARTQAPEPTAAARAEQPVIEAASWLSKKWWVPGLVVVGVVADLVENLVLYARFNNWRDILHDGQQLTEGDLGLGWLRFAGLVKWLALVLPLLVVVVFAIRQIARAVLLVVRALRMLWLQLLIVLVFVGAVAVPDQAADAVRRLSNVQWVFTLLLTALFVFVVLVTATSAIKPLHAAPRKAMIDGGAAPPSPPPSPADGAASPAQETTGGVPATWWPGLAVAAVGGAIIGVGWWSGWHGLFVPGWIIVVVGGLSVVIDLLARAGGVTRQMLDAADAANLSEQPMIPADRLAAVRRVGICLAAVPVAALGVAVVRATAGDLALLGAGAGWARVWRLVIGLALTMSAGALVLVLRPIVDFLTGRSRIVRLGVFAALVGTLGLGVMLHDPDVNLTIADDIGALGLVTVFLAGMSLLPTAAAWASYGLMWFKPLRPIALPSAVRILRVRSTPVLGLIVLWVVLAGTVKYASYHDVRRLPGRSPGAESQSVDDVAARWYERQERDPGTRPALLVASSGGGIRAAYWTAAVLDCLIERDGPVDDPCGVDAPAEVVAARRRALLAMSGISGGSLGLAAYVAAVDDQWSADAASVEPLPANWYEDRLAGDYLAPTVAAWLFNDGLNALVRPERGVDRAAVLERAWEADWDGDELTAPFLTGQSDPQPLLLLNGFSVEDGCRVNTSVLAASGGAGPAECGAVDTGTVPQLRSTADLVALLCSSEDVRVSTAALNSARFPYVTPSGRLQQCRADDDDPSAPPDVEVVDGGYRETSGASTIAELWPHLDAALARTSDEGCATPLFLQIDNGYSNTELATSGRGVVNQFVTPINAVMASPRGVEDGARQATFELFSPDWYRITTSAHPGSSAPLGWVLSSDARSDLQRQLTHPTTVRDIIALRARLDAAAGECS